MEGIEQPATPAADKAAQGRVAQACQRCRSLKTRCLLSERSGTCQRCLNAKRDCVWAEAPRRVRKTRGPSRISQVEQKLDGLVASIVNAPVDRNFVAPPTESRTSVASAGALYPTARDRSQAFPGGWLPFPSSFEQQESVPRENEENEAEEQHADAGANERFIEKLREIHNFSDDTNLDKSPEGIFRGQYKNEPGIENDYVKRLLSSGEAEILCNEYRSMCSSFPFVPLTNSTSAQSLSVAKPMLFLAILTVASWKNRLRQKILDKVYRTELGERTIVNPRKTLSLVQSILVYLSRYHFLFSHKTQQIFSLQQIAVGLAIDIGLHTKSRRSILGMSGSSNTKEYTPRELLERQRTYLGCYYLSSMISAGLQKPNLLKHTDYMIDCCRNLRQSYEISSDIIIARLIALRRLDDQIQDAFYSEGIVDLPLSDPRIIMNYKFLQTQIDDSRDDDCSEEYQRVIDLTSTYTRIQMHAISLRASPEPKKPGMGDSMQLNALLATLEACKQHLDILLTISASEYHLISFSEWMRLPFVLITGARICLPSDHLSAIQWDVKTAQERLGLDSYLAAIGSRMEAVSVSFFDFWNIMVLIMKEMRTWYLAKIDPERQNPKDKQTNMNGLPTPNATHTSLSSNGNNTPRYAMGSVCPVDHGMQLPVDSDIHMSGEDAFAFMRTSDFDMDKFFDMGLWGDQAYTDMGFGGGPYM
ncbi:hypothetical protein DM02DRAFT_591044 [Periconia macrospinosa]|uniref:Zn(2)-C6 fungal-type domain-containing protein n=1 Tax=Periconia macrospinosa TaxID=97972 RepID=A0A2V1DU34_9PLEO|nr:hypothetical protein DM02DRAFT_591044 [Periconia macrospinosa]